MELALLEDFLRRQHSQAGGVQNRGRNNKTDIGLSFVCPQSQRGSKQLRFRQSTERVSYCKFDVIPPLAGNLPSKWSLIQLDEFGIHKD
ncbi:hypothetical protein AVEN_144451-1 [Araneus ventricosus]|uniref:Uncharacterized protein n=1 Tax=Araneus ventricosus TaxID=182803 RepID=A0A4Y2E0L7_ARAVE|nr:hypothetical protein AVEN_144451-1 [Araneus ventricosus]